MDDLTKKWEQECSTFLKGKTIQEVRYMTKAEADKMGWFSRPLIFIFQGGGYMYASADDEGNDGGAMFTSDSNVDVIPVMRD